MNSVKASFFIETRVDGSEILKQIETAGRICYKSEDKITATSAKRFVKSIIEKGHESVLEHANVTVRVICDRGVSHEIVRHRMASYSQESTRYCNYHKDKFNNELNFVTPCFWSRYDDDNDKLVIWLETMSYIETQYMKLIELGAKPEEARAVLPNSLKTELSMTMNLREWRHFFKLRTAVGAHPQMREITIPMLEDFKRLIPIIFDDIEVIRDGQRPRTREDIRENESSIYSEDNGEEATSKEEE